MLYSDLITNILITYASENNLPFPMTIEENFNAVAVWAEKYVKGNIKAPYIDDDGNWVVWNVDTQRYETTKVSATGDYITDVEVAPHSVDAQGGEVYELTVTLASGKVINAGTFTAPRGVSVKTAEIKEV